MSSGGYSFENALFQWEEGWRRLQALSEDPAARRRADRVVDAIREELRRRIGSTFTAAELADLYGRGTDWCLQVAMDDRPRRRGDAQSLADAAFWLYLRGAADFAGGRRCRLSRRLLVRVVGLVASPPLSVPPPGRRMTIWSASIRTVTSRWPAQCSA